MVTVLPVNHWFFQLANASLLLSYLTRDVLHLRLALALAGLFFLLWGAFILAISIDTVVWNAAFFLFNILQACRIIYERRPIKFRDPAQEDVYEQLFRPVGVLRRDFKVLADKALTRTLKAGSLFIEEGNEAHNLSLLQKGRMITTKKVVSHEDSSRTVEKIVNRVKSFEFVESPEFAARITAATDRTEVENVEENQWWVKRQFARLKRRRGRVMPAEKRDEEAPQQQEELKEGEEREEEGDEVLVSPKIMAVSVKAETDCTFLTWPVEILLQILQKKPQLKAPIGSIVGADVARKLFRQTRITKAHFSEFQHLGSFGFLTLPTLEELSAEELEFIEELNRTGVDLKSVDLEKLFAFGKWRTIRRKGTVWVREGEVVQHLGYLYEGQMVAVKGEGKNEKQIFEIKERQFLGTFEYLDKEENGISKYTIKSVGPCRYLQWDVADLQHFVHLRPKLHLAFNTLCASDVAKKFANFQA